MISTPPKPKNSLSVDGVKVRRFEPGASSVYFIDFLKGCGYSIHGVRGHRYAVRSGKAGRFATMTKPEVLDLVDKERKKRGLEPFSI